MNLDEFFRRGQFAQKAVDEVVGKHRRAAFTGSYSVGDYVFARGRSGRLLLARIEQARPMGKSDLWQVRERRPEGWMPPSWRAVVRPLTPTEIAHNRKLGLIPQRGDAP